MTNPGTPAHEPTDITRRIVSELVAFGITHEKIAQRLEINETTLVKYYRKELDTGLTNAVHVIGNKLYSKAVDQDDLGAMIFYLKTRGRWSDQSKIDAQDANKTISEQVAAKNGNS